MAHRTRSRIFLVGISVVLLSMDGMCYNYVMNASWDGVAFNISVKRETIQKTLDAFHSSVSDTCGEGQRLFIPEKSFFPDLQTSAHHPVYVDVGYMSSHDFYDYLKNNPELCISVSGLEVAVHIPLLADDPAGPPVYALAVAVLYEKSRGDIPKPNFLCRYIPVEEIQLSDSEAFVRNGSDEMRVSFTRSNNPCKPSSFIVTEEFDELLDEFLFGLPEPDFSFCERHTFRSDFCTNANRVKCTINRHAPNICQTFKKRSVQPCEASLNIMNITPGFREFILLENDPINILASESYSDGPPLIGLKSPCQE
ncbi:hypothetical protein HOLleu_39071 [Holothuria leucospilota]|uniref:Uncharacterized protein n=1 Tax=Holothuria leucospilota TaxID=206669 RepID=A0A9Q0YKB4_HOLLE|nr:hypothetical protein HOLleu_39071 [Holothuria leucospilota]